MKNILKKIGTCAVAALLGVSAVSFAGCSDENANKTTISIHYYNGGLGSDWIREVIAEFEEMFADVSFEEGKTGVHVALTPDKNFNETPTSMMTGAEKADILYTADSGIVSYLTTENIVYDATDIALDKVYDENGNVQLAADGKSFVQQEYSMYDRMHPYYQSAYNLAGTRYDTENDGGYYFPLLPYEDTLSGIVIDYDLYSQLCKDYGLDSEMTGYLFEGDDVRMPGTWDEFFELLTTIRDQADGTYSGFTYAIDYYTPALQNAVIADVDGTDEGVENKSEYSGIRMYDTYDGAYDFDGDGTKETTITADNAYMLTQTRGYEAMTEIAFRLFESNASGGNIFDNNVMQNPSYSVAQMDFVMSKTSSTNPRILAIFEGDWWENEARASFDSMGAINAEDGYGKRTFRMMPVPHMTSEEVEEGKTYKVGGFSSGYPIVLNQKTLGNDEAKAQVAKLWIQFQHSVQSMQTFTRWSGSVLPYIYEVTDDVKEQMTPFAQSILEIQMQDRAADGQIEIVRRNQLTMDDEVRTTSNTIDFRAQFRSWNLTNGAIIANMVNLRNPANNFNWRSSDIADMVEEYMEGMLTAHQ